MAANLLIDSKARPVPQVLSDDETAYIHWKGKNGSGFVYVPNGYDETLGSTADTETAGTVNGNILKAVGKLTSLDSSLNTKLANLITSSTSIESLINTLQDTLTTEVLTTPAISRPSIFPSSTRTGSGTTGEIYANGHDKGVFFVDVTSVDAGATLKIEVQSKDPESNKWFPVASTAVISAVSQTTLYVDHGFGYKYRVAYTITGANVKFSVGAILK